MERSGFFAVCVVCRAPIHWVCARLPARAWKSGEIRGNSIRLHYLYPNKRHPAMTGRLPLRRAYFMELAGTGGIGKKL